MLTWSPISFWQQLLTYYELDLGLNHVVRKWSEATDPRANLLVQGQQKGFRTRPADALLSRVDN